MRCLVTRDEPDLQVRLKFDIEDLEIRATSPMEVDSSSKGASSADHDSPEVLAGNAMDLDEDVMEVDPAAA